MEDADLPDVGSSPNINSVLKPPKPRIPLKDLMSAAHDEDNTAGRKRRVSFANVNKIKEFSAGAESMVVCHTPAYEEPFSVSSDSSYPSGVDGWTPAKTNPATNPIQAIFSTDQKENLVVENISRRPSLLVNQAFPPHNMYYPTSDYVNVLKESTDAVKVSRSLSNSRTSDLFFQSNNTLWESPSNALLDEMEITNCVNIHQGTVRNSTRFSIGMDFTSVVGQSLRSINSSTEGMDLTRAAIPQQQLNDQRLSLHFKSSANSMDGSSLNDSDALDFTDAVNEPLFATASGMPSVPGLDVTGNVIYSVNNTKYSESGMDLTKVAISRHSVGRQSTRYSLNNMDLTEAIGICDHSALDFTEDVKKPRMIANSTRYSTNDMDLTEGIVNKEHAKFYSVSMDCNDVGDELEYSADSETSMDFTKPIHNIYQSTCDKGNVTPSSSNMESTNVVREKEVGKIKLCSTDVNSSKTYANIAECQYNQSNKTYVLENTEPSSEHFVEENFDENNTKKECNIQPDPSTCKSMKIDLREHNCLNPNMYEKISEGITVLKPNISMDISERDTNSKESCLSQPTMIITTDYIENKSVVKVGNTNVLTNHYELLENQQTTIMNNDNMDSSGPPVLNHYDDYRKELNPVSADEEKSEDKKFDKQMSNMNISSSSLEGEANIEKDNVVRNFEDAEQIQTIQDHENSLNDRFGVQPQFTLIQSNLDEMEVSIIDSKVNCDENEKNENCASKVFHLDTEINSYTEQDSKTETNEDYKMGNEIEKVLDCNVNYEDVKERMTGYCEEEKLSMEMISEDSHVKKPTTPVHVLSDTLANDSQNNTYLNNITFTRGAATKYNTTMTFSQDLLNKSNTKDNSLAAHKSEHTSVLETSSQRIAMNIHTEHTCSAIHTDESTNAESVANKSQKGGKRSFEIALQPENDTEESPVKLMCLKTIEPPLEHDFLSNVTAPSFMLDTLSAPHDSITILNHSTNSNPSNSLIHEQAESSIQLNVEKTTSENNLLKDRIENDVILIDDEQAESSIQLIVEKTTSENNLLKDRIENDVTLIDDETKSSLVSVGNECENSFSLRVDVSAGFSVSKHVRDQKVICPVSIEITETCQKDRRKDLSKTLNQHHKPSNSTLNYTYSHKNSLTSKDKCVSQSSFFLPSLVKHTVKIANGYEKVDATSKIMNLCNNETEPITRSSLLIRNADILSKNKNVKDLGNGVFAYPLIPKWIELQFSLDSCGSITNTVYNIVCPDQDQLIGKYLLQQVKTSFLCEDPSGLLRQLQETPDTFLPELARNVSLICKYYTGNLKGNILTLEVVSCKNHFWTFVDVNIKHPKFLSQMDITISEQRIGELRLSQVRQIFGSIEKTSHQMLDFAEALAKIQY